MKSNSKMNEIRRQGKCLQIFYIFNIFFIHNFYIYLGYNFTFNMFKDNYLIHTHWVFPLYCVVSLRTNFVYWHLSFETVPQNIKENKKSLGRNIWKH